MLVKKDCAGFNLSWDKKAAEDLNMRWAGRRSTIAKGSTAAGNSASSF